MNAMIHLREELSKIAAPSIARLAVRGWLEFVRDWGQLDVRPLLEEVEVDDEMHDAVAAIIETGHTAWGAFEALRSFCVQRLFGADRMAHEDMFRPLAGLSPFSVPVELLRSVFSFHEHEFNPLGLGTKTVFKKIPIGDTVGFKANEQVPQDQLWLMTALWAQAFPPTEQPLWGEINLVQVGCNRCFKHSLLGALTKPQPLFLYFCPNDGIEIEVCNVNIDEHVDLFVFVEGWMYTIRR